LGNLLGYTFFKQICVDMYYGSYSLPTYVTIWNAEAFLLTTVIPFLLMLLITAVILWYQLTLPPLKFLRRDLSHRRSQRALPLSGHLPFFFRFHLRVLLQNMSSYLLLWIGILFANLLLMFGLIFPSILSHYQEELEQNMLCNYQYILQVPLNAMQEDKKLQSLLYMMRFQQEVETSQENAEKFTAYSLKTIETTYPSEEVLLYGIQPDSLYLPLSFSGDGVYISSAYADKFGLLPGDTITLKEAYEDHFYDFSIEGIYNYTGALAIFLPQEQLNDLFDLGDSYFSGYFSQEPITDIDEKYIGSVIDLEALTKISRQLDVSMGSMMYLVDGFSILMFLVLIYLLSRTIIEKNARSISMVKILGYRDSEICRLYILSTSVVVIIFLLLSLPIEYRIMKYIFRVVMLTSISGWIPFYMDSGLYVQMFSLGLSAYCLVLLPEYRKIRRIPMDEILKYTE
jgi:putative ABC transport system permease protein